LAEIFKETDCQLSQQKLLRWPLAETLYSDESQQDIRVGIANCLFYINKLRSIYTIRALPALIALCFGKYRLRIHAGQLSTIRVGNQIKPT